MATTMKLIGKVVLSSNTATVTFSSIPGTYTDIVLAWSARGDRASSTTQNYLIGFNGSTANFTNCYLEGTGSSAISGTNEASGRYLGPQTAAAATSNTFASGECHIPNYAGSTNKSFSVTNAHETNATAAYITAIAGLWSNTAAITSIELTTSPTHNFVSGSSFFLYGITKA
jgi:hypothetical protein